MIRLLQYFNTPTVYQKLLNIINADLPIKRDILINDSEYKYIACLDTRQIVSNPWYEMFSSMNMKYNYIFINSSRHGVLAIDTAVRAIKQVISEESNIKILCINISSIYKTERLKRGTAGYTYNSVNTYYEHYFNTANLFLHFYNFVKNVKYIELLCKLNNIHLFLHCNTGIISNYVLKKYINNECYVGGQLTSQNDKKIFNCFIKKLKKQCNI